MSPSCSYYVLDVLHKMKHSSRVFVLDSFLQVITLTRKWMKAKCEMNGVPPENPVEYMLHNTLIQSRNWLVYLQFTIFGC